MALIHIETRTKNLPDSGAWQIHKFGTAAGEQRIALEGNCETDPSLFDFYTKDVDFYFCTKSDMLDYISAIQEEINHPTQNYSYKNYPFFYKGKIKEINEYPSDFIVMHFAANPRRGGTAYLASVSTEDSDNYNFLRSICLSSERQGKKNAYTTFLFVKYQNTKTGKYYINLVPTFSKIYTMDELSKILKRELENAEDIHVAINLFGLKYADQIINEEYNCQELMYAAGYKEDDYSSELETAVKVYEHLKDNKVTINPISDKLGLLGAYIENKQPLLELISSNESEQRIYYGAPGTGKSNAVKKQTGELLEYGEEKDLPNVFRTTFHPDTDYASFVGCYKPTMKLTSKEEKTLTGKDEEIVYEFVPQAFTDAYVYAYNNPTEQTYLVIEEINRGNCAQIFGDLFQLLDRKGGVSEYKIKADKDLAKYLSNAKDETGKDILVNKEGIKDGELCLPANLNILATMNTSDQSLFPMDSAFKRRWEWEYVPINYGTGIKSGTFEITIGKEAYPWVRFIKEVNDRIFDLTQSEDKQLGNFFVKHSVDEKEFKSKVMFYLWYEVLRDETENNKYFFYKKTTIEGKDELGKFIFKDLYEPDATETLQQFMEYLGVAPK